MILILALPDLKPIERRVLEYLDQHGPMHRAQIVSDLAAPGSRWGFGFARGSNGAAPLIMGRWCKRLIAAGLVCQHNPPSKFYNRRGEYYKTLHFYSHHEITEAGRELLRSHAFSAIDTPASAG